MPKSGKGDKLKKNCNNNDKPYTRQAQDSTASSEKIVDEKSDEPSICPVCDQSIRELSEDGKDPGDETLCCEGTCKGWYHRKCVGISKRAYDIASESDNLFYCLFCMQHHYNNVIADLKTQICTLVSKFNQSQPAADQTPSTNSSSSSISTATAAPPNTGRILAFPVSGNVPETMMKCHMFFMWLSNFLLKNWCDSLQIFLCSITAVQDGITYRISFSHCVPAK